MGTGKRFSVVYLPEASEFVNSLPVVVKEKIVYNVRKSTHVIDPVLFKKLDSEIWEFRTPYNGMEYRLLAFWDKQHNRLVVATHGFVKKSQKTPPKEIARAKAIMKEYYK